MYRHAPVATITESKSVARYLSKLGEGRGPAYWNSTVLRRKVLAGSQ